MRLRPPLFALIAGFVLTFAYPRWNEGWVVWFWMLPLLYALWGWQQPLPAPGLKGRVQKDPVPTRWQRLKRGFGLAYIAGLAFFIPNLHWVRHSSRVISGARDNTWIGWGPELMGMGAVIGLALYLSLYWGLWGAFAATIGKPRINIDGNPDEGDNGKLFSVSLESLRSAFLCAAAWVACEWLRSVVFTGFGWNGLAVPLWKTRALIQSVEFVGVIGLSFLPAFVAVIVWNTVLRFRQEVRTSRVRPHADFFFAVSLMLLNAGYGAKCLVEKPQPGIKVNLALVQLNIGQQEKWEGRAEIDAAFDIYEQYGRQTELALGLRPDLVIWPESALSFPFHDPNHVPFLNDVLALGDYSLLTGADILMPNQPNYTGAALMRGRFENHQIYRKVHLVPFGEYLPLRHAPGMNALLGNVIAGDFHSGDSTEPLMLQKPSGVQIIPLICFEDTVGRLARKFARNEPQLIVNMTNDGWFLHSEANEQHLSNAVFRAVELRRPMVRACNTGVTCVIDKYGRIPQGGMLQDASGSPFVRSVLSREVYLAPNPGLTIYARFGDVFSIGMLAITGLAVVGRMFRKKKIERPKPKSVFGEYVEPEEDEDKEKDERKDEGKTRPKS